MTPRQCSAVNAEGRPGTVATYAENDFLDGHAPLRLTDHDGGLVESLAQLRMADSGPAEVIVLGVVPASCEFGAGISPAVLAASSTALEHLKKLLTERGIDCHERRDKLQPDFWWLAADSTSEQSRTL